MRGQEAMRTHHEGLLRAVEEEDEGRRGGFGRGGVQARNLQGNTCT